MIQDEEFLKCRKRTKNGHGKKECSESWGDPWGNRGRQEQDLPSCEGFCRRCAVRRAVAHSPGLWGHSSVSRVQ